METSFDVTCSGSASIKLFGGAKGEGGKKQEKFCKNVKKYMQSMQKFAIFMLKLSNLG